MQFDDLMKHSGSYMLTACRNVMKRMVLVQITIFLKNKQMMKMKVLRNRMTPAEYQRLPGGEVPGT